MRYYINKTRTECYKKRIFQEQERVLGYLKYDKRKLKIQ